MGILRQVFQKYHQPIAANVNLYYRMTLMKDYTARIPVLLSVLYTDSWLDEKAVADPENRTNREVEIGVSLD